MGINSVIFCGNVYYGLRGCGNGVFGRRGIGIRGCFEMD